MKGWGFVSSWGAQQSAEPGTWADAPQTPHLGSQEPRRCDGVPPRGAPTPRKDFLCAAHRRAGDSRPGTGLWRGGGLVGNAGFRARGGMLLREVSLAQLLRGALEPRAVVAPSPAPSPAPNSSSPGPLLWDGT